MYRGMRNKIVMCMGIGMCKSKGKEDIIMTFLILIDLLNNKSFLQEGTTTALRRAGRASILSM